MFTIIGTDGKQYGPVSTSQVRSWVAAGRANLDTQTRAVGSDEWRRLGDFPELSDRPVSTPPPLPDPLLSGSSLLDSTDAPEVANRGARTGAALLNAFVYFLSMMPGSVMMSRQLLEQNPEFAKGGIPRLDDLDLTGLAGSVMWVWAGLLTVIALQALLIAIRGQNFGKIVLKI